MIEVYLNDIALRCDNAKTTYEQLICAASLRSLRDTVIAFGLAPPFTSYYLVHDC